ncbi:MAG: type II toxin-antitoxin system PemK/MazF family toxin [Thermomicrobiales bacterium]|nr:type II toxin-antitoxin system PemK/MazF family toxin [Thermomicrobiales bacterium]
MSQRLRDFAPKAGEIWDAVLDPTQGREQAGRRPVLIVSSTRFNTYNGSLVIAVPVTSTERRVEYQVEIPAGEGGLSKDSTALPEQVRTLDFSRLKKYRSEVRPQTLATVREMIRELLTD